MKRKILALFILLVSFAGLTHASSPKREMRSGWLATVWKIDWPTYTVSQTGDATAINRQKDQLISILDKMKAANVNSVFFQIRSRCDAMYNSSYEPWSSDLVATRGLDPGYDPLEFAIQEAHKRGMELHAWLNPYRYESVAGQWTGENDYRQTHPDWLLQVGDAVILNPGLPEVRQRISDIVAEIVQNYDVNGVIFDDYFYTQGITTQDAATASQYNTEGLSIGDWRRGNVNKMISDVHTRIKSIKPYVEFGVSPAGVWDGGATVAAKYGIKLPTGVASSGYQYNGIYSDPLAWMKEKSIDYISPQIYWPTTHSTAPYKPLSDWWSYVSNFMGVKFYSSHSLSEITNIPTLAAKSVQAGIGADSYSEEGMSMLEKALLSSSDAIGLRATTTVASDYLLQVESNRTYDRNGAPGSVFYSVKSLIKTGLPEYLKANVFQNPSLRPALWSAGGVEEFVTNIRIDGDSLRWDYSGQNRSFTVYAIPNADVAKVGNFANSINLQGVVYSQTAMKIPADKPSSAYKYAVAVFDRFNNEYSAKFVGNETVNTGAATTLSYPANGAEVVLPDNFKWTAVSDAEFYIVEFAKDAAFTDIVYKREVIHTEISGDDLLMLQTGVEYYWRVSVRRVSTKDAVSAASKFLPTRFSLTSPAEAEETTVTPTVKWTSIAVASKYKLEVATSSGMNTGIVVSQELAGAEYTIEKFVLTYGTKYYARVTALSAQGEKVAESSVVSFTTETEVPPVPQILTPIEGSQISTTNLTVTWTGSEYASKYEIELSTSASFPARNTVTNLANAYTYETIFSSLKMDQNYYIRLKALYGSNSTNWSPVVHILTAVSSLEESENGARKAYVYVKDGSAYLSVDAENNEPLFVSLYDISGQKIQDLVSDYRLNEGSGDIEIPVYQILPKGVYLVKIQQGSSVYGVKFLK